jgi:hypothetical protein
MNERIETLAKAAGYDMINKAAMRALGFDKEKFAELIVRECAEFVSNDRQNDEYGVFVSNRIKEHFGVEE